VLRVHRLRLAGNVRELENVIERAIVTCRNGSLEAADFSSLHRGAAQSHDWEAPDVPLGELERRAIVAALERKHGNMKGASSALGLDRSTLAVLAFAYCSAIPVRRMARPPLAAEPSKARREVDTCYAG
jgi:transcriptional regulator of acetoin/glycerol metabolism